MARVFLSLGSNLGDRWAYLDQALRRLGTDRAIRVIACSPVYETEPWPEQRAARERWYLNCAVEIETELAPRRLLRLLHEIEAGAGRKAPAEDRGLLGAALPAVKGVVEAIVGHTLVISSTNSGRLESMHFAMDAREYKVYY
jgi:2-amino-4-hydroxy-6-hydroxymethyldihydropteridine diphosphokinase